MICSSVNRLRFMGLPPTLIQRWKIPVRNGPDKGGKIKSPGRSGVFQDYRLRIANVIRDYGMFDRAQAPLGSRKAHAA